MKPLIGLTIGDPAGVGPEIVLKAVSRPSVRASARFVVYGDRSLLSHVNKRVLRRSRLPDVQIIDFQNVSLRAFRFGVATADGGRASGEYIQAAVRAALQSSIDAVVTAPINKQSFRMGGWGEQFTGHTEMVTALTGARRSALMLVHEKLRAIHVTSHIPLKRVASSLTRARVFDTVELAGQALKSMGVSRARIAVCGLNPHAGDNGLLGREEQTVIGPAIELARRRGLNAHGPFSADTVWPMVEAEIYDAGVAMYHDQGQIPVKLRGFTPNAVVRGVNVTIGLPIVRTSVAHGTGYEIAGKGRASEQSLIDAISLAVQMASRRR